MSKNFKFDSVVFYKETTEGQIPTSPKALGVKGYLSCDVKETQKTETNETLDSAGQGVLKDRGTSDFAGNIENKLAGGMIPWAMIHSVGAATKTDQAASAWATATTYAVFDKFALTGDIVNHSDGNHSLVVKSVSGTGTSGATEPDLTGKVSGDTVIDNPGANQIVWIVAKKIKKYVGESENCLETFGMEYDSKSSCSGSEVTFTKRFEGCYLNSFGISKSSGSVIHKYSFPVVAMNASDNVNGDSDGTAFESVKDKAGYTVQSMNDLPFGYDELKVQIGGAEPVNARSFDLTISRNVSVADEIAVGKKDSNIPTMSVEGSLMIKFTKDEYEKAYENEIVEVKVMFGKQNGSVLQLTFPKVQKDRVDPDFSTNEPAYLNIPLTAGGDSTQKTLSYICYSEIDY